MELKIFENLSLENIKGEVWKDVLEYEDIYQISNKGRIKAKDRTIYYDSKIGAGIRPKKIHEKIRKQKINKHTGYLMVGFNGKGKSKNYTIHSLVGEAFLGYKRGQGKKGSANSVNHKDGNKFNNCVENLEVVTLAENVRHMFKTGLSTTNHRVIYKDVEYYSKSEMRRKLKISYNKQNKLIEKGECVVIK